VKKFYKKLKARMICHDATTFVVVFPVWDTDLLNNLRVDLVTD